MSRKQRRKELEQPDQFEGFWADVVKNVAAKKKQVTTVLVLVLIGIGGAWAGVSHKMSQTEVASRAFGRIQKIATAALLPETPSVAGEKTGDSTIAVAAAASPKPPDDGLPHYKTETERLEAAVSEADKFIAGNKDKFRSEAFALRGSYLLTLGKNTEAAESYREASKSARVMEMRFVAEKGLAVALEGEKKFTEAIETLKKLGTAKGDFQSARTNFDLARLEERQGHKDAAIKLYKKILEDYEKTPLRTEINTRLAELEDS